MGGGAISFIYKQLNLSFRNRVSRKDNDAEEEEEEEKENIDTKKIEKDTYKKKKGRKKVDLQASYV